MHFKSKLKYLCLLILLYPIPFSHSEILIDQKDFQASEDNALTFDTINVCVEGDCYDILQVSGAIETKTAGGIAKKDRKTIYVFLKINKMVVQHIKGKIGP